MRTTIELPDALLREAKATAALRGVSLKTFFTEAVNRLLHEPGPSASPRMERPPLRAGKTIPARSNAELARLLDQEEGAEPKA